MTLARVNRERASRLPLPNSVKITPRTASCRYHPQTSVSLVHRETAERIPVSTLSEGRGLRTFSTFTSISRKHREERSALFRSQQRILRKTSSVRTSWSCRFKERRNRTGNPGKLVKWELAARLFVIGIPVSRFKRNGSRAKCARARIELGLGRITTAGRLQPGLPRLHRLPQRR